MTSGRGSKRSGSGGAGAVASVAALLLALLFAAPAAAGEDWEPIKPEELALNDDPLLPGAAAVMLYRAEHIDYVKNGVWRYYRIKILKEQGKKHADVQIPFAKGAAEVKNLQARLIRPDGTVVPFQGTMFDKPVHRRKGVEVMAKTFAFPEAEVGSIVEYRYRLNWIAAGQTRLQEELGPRGLRLGWEVQGELSLLRGDFRIHWPRQATKKLAWNLIGLPATVDMKELGGDWWGIQVENIPAFEAEPFMLPKEMYAVGAYFYSLDPSEAGSNEGFWKRTGSFRHAEGEGLVMKHEKRARREVAALTGPGDDPETKLRKIYERVQRVRNLSYEPWKTEKEAKAEGLKERQDLLDVLKYGYGTFEEIHRLFILMARAAGFPAEEVLVVTRDQRLFHREIWDSEQFNDVVVWVRVGEKDVYLDPGNPFCPYGMLPWEKTGIQGLRLGKEGGEIVKLPEAQSEMAVFQRKAEVNVDDEGTLSGTLSVEVRGLGAIAWREALNEEDELKRREEAEKWIRNWLPAGASVEITQMPGWEQNNQPVAVEATVRVPDFAVATGQRLMVPTGIFQTKDRVRFEHAERKYPIYFAFPWEEKDAIELRLPTALEVEGLPEEKSLDVGGGRYRVAYRTQGSSLHIRRELAVRGIFFPLESYPTLREFFNQVKSGDEGHAILRKEPVAQRD